MKGHMPIITPANPQQNSTFNVTKSTLYQMKQEFKKYVDLTADIVENKTKTWKDFFEKREFFSEHRLYVHVLITAKTTDSFRTWEGYMESKIRKLIAELEKTINIKYAVPLADKFTDPDCDLPNSNFFLGLVTEKNSSDPTNQIIDLSRPVANFTFLVKTYPIFNIDEMDIKVSWHKRTQLPNFCFPDGKPKRRRKRKREQTIDSSAQKIQKIDAESDVSTNNGSEDNQNKEDNEESNNTTEKEEVVEEEEEQVEIPVVPELVEIGGKNDQWNSVAVQEVTKKPKVTLMNRN